MFDKDAETPQKLRPMRLTIACLVVSALFPSLTKAQAPTGAPFSRLRTVDSSVKFDVQASVAIDGTFDKWNATLTFTSPDVTTGVLDFEIQADSVNTGSGMKNGKLKGKDFFDVKQNPLITFLSKRSFRPVPTPLTCRATLRYAESPNPRR